MTLNRYITVADIMSTEPCYIEEKVIELFAGRKRARLSTVLNSEIPPEDKIWLVSRFLPDKINREFARWCALQVVHLWDCPAIVRQYLETGDESTRDAAWAAYGAAAGACDAAASCAAASDTAWYAARGAARAAQIEKLKEMIG